VSKETDLELWRTEYVDEPSAELY